MSNTEEIVQIINAIGSQWPFMLTLFGIIVITIKWKTIWKALGGIKKIKIKSGVGEVELDSNDNKELRLDIKDIQKVQKAENVVEKDESENTLFHCYIKLRDGDINSADKIFESVQKETPEEERFQNQIIYLYYKFLNGISNSIESFNDIIEDNNLGKNDKYFAYLYLALCFKKAISKEKAISSFNKAIEFSSNESERVDCIIYISQTFFENNSFSDATNILIENLRLVKLDKSRIKIYKELASIYSETKVYILEITALEKALALMPNDTSLLFDLAFSYSKISYDKVGIFHYNNLLNFNSDNPIALNNIAVGFKKEGLQFEAIDYYKQAVEKDNSLAAGNLAFLYLQNGFESEAIELINKFKTKDNVDQMLINAHNSLIQKLNNEKEIVKSIIEAGKSISLFFRNYGETIFQIKEDDNYKDNSWTDIDNNKINVELKNLKLRITWNVSNPSFDVDDEYLIEGECNNKGFEILFSIPSTLSSSFFSPLSDTIKPIRTTNKYSGYCSLNIENEIIEILYLKGKEIIIKKIWKMPNA